MFGARIPWCRKLAAIVIVLTSSGGACAQDRPLLEPLRIGYARAEAIADRLRDTPALERALRRKGFVSVWREFSDGLAALRSLDADEIDLALVVALNDVVVAKRENRKMVFITELRSIAPSCCDKDEIFADHMFKRYTLSSEYLADYREDVLLVLHQETIKVLEQSPERQPASVGFVSRGSMKGASSTIGTRSQVVQIDDTAEIADVNYWVPTRP